MSPEPSIPHTEHGLSSLASDDVTYLDDHRRSVQQRRSGRDLALRHELERRLADAETRRVTDAHLGFPSPQRLRHHHDVLAERILAEIRKGASVHRRLAFVVRQVPWSVALLDGLVLFTFCAAIFNVSLSAPFTLEGAFAAMLALLGTGVAYCWLAMAGFRLRCYRTELGDVDWAVTGWLTRCMLAISWIVALALSALMYLRVVGDVAQAAPAGYLGASSVVALGMVFAVISVAANLAVVAVHALDGSEAAHELRHAGRVLHRHENRQERTRRRLRNRLARTGPARR